jgi:hypothetical protein
MCKPHKLEGQKLRVRVTFGEWRRLMAAREQLEERPDGSPDRAGSEV